MICIKRLFHLVESCGGLFSIQKQVSLFFFLPFESENKFALHPLSARIASVYAFISWFNLALSSSFLFSQRNALFSVFISYVFDKFDGQNVFVHLVQHLEETSSPTNDLIEWHNEKHVALLVICTFIFTEWKTHMLHAWTWPWFDLIFRMRFLHHPSSSSASIQWKLSIDAFDSNYMSNGTVHLRIHYFPF